MVGNPVSTWKIATPLTFAIRRIGCGIRKIAGPGKLPGFCSGGAVACSIRSRTRQLGGVARGVACEPRAECGGGVSNVRIRRIVTTRAGGASQAPYDSFNLGRGVGDDQDVVTANRRRLATELGLAENRLVFMDQIHGRTVAVVDSPTTEPPEGTDAIVTAEPGLALVVLVADCVPILLADPEAGVVAAVHAGRVGARIGVVPAALKTMVEVGAETSRIEAFLGPSVCGECYEVPADMQADVERHLPDSACKSRKGTPALDLRAGLWRQLAEAGVAKIGVDPRCTFETPDLFSHRRNQPTGRFGAITWFEPDTDR